MDKVFLTQFFLEAFPNPERIGCPDMDALRAVAERRVSLFGPTFKHLTSCSECFSEYNNFRLDYKEAQFTSTRS